MGMIEDLMKALDRIPTWKRVSTLPAELDALRERVVALEAKLSGPTAEQCPKCMEPRFMLMDSRPDPTFGVVGGQQDDLRCLACGYTEQRLRRT